MKIKPVLKKNPINGKELFYLYPVYTDTLELRDLLPEISNASSITAGDVRAVVESFVEILQRYLVRGNKIKIDGIGVFKLSIKSSGNENAKEITANDVLSTKVTYLSDSKLRNYVDSNIRYEKIKEDVSGKTETN
ncbi:MAG: HU family DNA-binding protein [Treponema sp.]|nr:HU family DNA-binding protein [Treponema sp.]